ncbi:hypothetical protein [Streptomyces sp. MP131-18]|uniref:hypothetical protein n=1 Tax=Streptomyces sp. MP131-18 TaxID=1857892 RepID=UPI0011804B81|nr:hypothetical protein [Streptomyces sp. MP131-18]
MDIASIRRTLNGTLTELQRAIDNHTVAEAASLYELAWSQAAQAPPSKTKEQRAQLKVFKEILASPEWREEERRQARSERPKARPAPGRPAVPKARPAADTVPERRKTVWSSDAEAATPRTPRPAPALGRPARAKAPALLATSRLWELATDLRPLLEQTARARATTSWPAIRKHLPGLPRLHPDDESILLWLVDEEREAGEPLLSALVTIRDRQMNPRFPQIAQQLGLPTGSTRTEQQTAWSYEVLKAHQHWRHRRA